MEMPDDPRCHKIVEAEGDPTKIGFDERVLLLLGAIQHLQMRDEVYNQSMLQALAAARKNTSMIARLVPWDEIERVFTALGAPNTPELEDRNG